MARVICSLPNASDFINGVRFVSHKAGVISEEINDETAAAFAQIKGYVVADKKGRLVDTPPADAAAQAEGASPPAD